MGGDGKREIERMRGRVIEREKERERKTVCAVFQYSLVDI